MPAIATISRLFLIAGGLLLAACASQQTAAPDTPAKARLPEYPGISLYYKRASAELQQECDAFQRRSILHHCNQHPLDLSLLQKNLANSGAFQQVALAEERHNYQVMVSAVVLDEESGSELGQAALSGATLMLVPIKLEKTIRAEIVVTWEQLPIQRYSYELPFSYSASLLNPAFDYQDKLTNLVATQFLSDLQQQNVFAGAFLMAALEASDYESDMGITDAVGDYFFDDKHIFNNPFHGTGLTFRHREFAFDRAEVFVYPVRNTDWQQAAAHTRNEAENVRAELEMMQQQGALHDLDLDAIKALHWDLEGIGYDGVFYSALMTDNDQQQAHSTTYIFIKGDKFIRVHATFPVTEGSAAVSNPDAFVKALLQQIQPPAESLFMAKLRQRRRETAVDLSVNESTD